MNSEDLQKLSFSCYRCSCNHKARAAIAIPLEGEGSAIKLGSVMIVTSLFDTMSWDRRSQSMITGPENLVGGINRTQCHDFGHYLSVIVEEKP